MRYSVIIPVYNRLDEVNELLESLTQLKYKSFEVIIVEDGSTHTCKTVVDAYSGKLDIRYVEKENSGQGFSRNYGFERAKGDFLVVFDSDCLVPPHYFDAVNDVLTQRDIDCWGGPDRAHPTFTPVQKAINYSMTSMFTTGGIRGNKERVSAFYPRSFNMGISREVYEKTGGYKITRMGEDLEFSVRIEKMGFKTELIERAYVYHKRRTNFLQFYKQLYFFGRARINLNRFHPGQIKLLHILPFLFGTGFILSLLALMFSIPYLTYLIWPYILFALIIAIDSFKKEKSFKISILSIFAGFVQLTGYGAGFAREILLGTAPSGK
jgi:glycosyltransferase involved in cell wall biosynthesis